MRAPRHRGGTRTERGAATALAAGLALVLVTAGTAAVMVTGAVLAEHRAAAAADLAALAGAVAVVEGLDPCRAATSVAEANGVTLTACRPLGTSASAVVSVTVAAKTGLRSPLPDVVHASATAGNVAR